MSYLLLDTLPTIPAAVGITNSETWTVAWYLSSATGV